MAITTAMCASFKQELAQAYHNFLNGGDNFNLGLFVATPSGTYGAGTTNYSNVTGNSDELSTSGYTAGGQTLTNISPANNGTVGYWSFNNVTWTTVTFTSEGAFIYNTGTKGGTANRMVAVFDFGGNKSSTAGNFVIQMPTNGATTSVLRIA